MRCDNLLKNERRKSSFGITSVEYIDDIGYDQISELESELDLETIIENDKTGILQLIKDGYTQKEIAKILGISQSWITRVLKKLRKEYEFDR